LTAGVTAVKRACALNVGYTDVAHLDGGINAWKEQGKPVEDSSG
jgi:rhodanese-related sulfurtransferase